MSDLIRLNRGGLPWNPTGDSTIVRVFNEYDIPLEGVILQDGCFYLFECLAGQMTLPGLWIYTHISSADLAKLDEAEGDAFEKLVGGIRLSRPGKFAISIRGEGLIAYAAYEELSEAQAALDDLSEQLNEYVAEATRTQEEVSHMTSSPEWAKLTPA